MLRAAVELELLALDDPRHRPQSAELVIEAVGPGQLPDENPFLVRIVLFFTHYVCSFAIPRHCGKDRIDTKLTYLPGSAKGVMGIKSSRHRRIQGPSAACSNALEMSDS